MQVLQFHIWDLSVDFLFVCYVVKVISGTEHLKIAQGSCRGYFKTQHYLFTLKYIPTVQNCFAS